MTTKLDILNAMLGVNGEAPVSSVSSTNPAAVQALNMLRRTDRKIQSRGWWFNKERFTLSPDTSGEIILPANTMAVDPVDPRSPYVKRGSRLYDRVKNTYVINASVDVIIVLQLEVEETPDAYINYLEDKSVKEYYIDDDGDEQKVSRLDVRERESYMYLYREDLANKNVNITTSDMGQRLMRATFMGNRSVYKG